MFAGTNRIKKERKMSYLNDGTVVLKKGSRDLTGEKRYGKPANVPGKYVEALQKDLAELGFSPGSPDGAFGDRTEAGVKNFQTAASGTQRLKGSGTVIVAVTFKGNVNGRVDAQTKKEISLWKAQGWKALGPVTPPWVPPAPAKKVGGVKFATPTSKARFWPICTGCSGGREVAYIGANGRIYGREGRRFLAGRRYRNGRPTRYHVGVDLWGDEGDYVVACEDGVIVNHYHFYRGVHALIVQCDSGHVINYGEVRADSWKNFGLDKGSAVKAGQPIALVGKMRHDSMCHFEMYVKGTQRSQRWMMADPKPPALLDPTRYLLHLAEKGMSFTSPVEIEEAAPPASVEAFEAPAVTLSCPGLLSYHRAFSGGVRWRLVPAGVEIEGSGVERTPGEPRTATRIWETYGKYINQWARHYKVPCALILATIATESGGRADALRIEPGYKSDGQTPHRVSPGLMQTLISTARATLKNNSINRKWRLEPKHSIQAGTCYIAEQKQKKKTELDPPKVACAYNAGGVYINESSKNRWRMRQYPINSAEHCDRFVKWFNDAVYVLKDHDLKPSVPYQNYFS
jgi:murein DD-endopeptidase MepM/ murein hydrolase activator NlpD